MLQRRDHRRTADQRFLVAWVVAAIAPTSTVVGCGSAKGATPNVKSATPTFLLSEFIVRLDRPSLPHGTLRLAATNAGAEEHELVLVRAASLADLPIKSDGSVDEDRIPESDKVGEIDHVKAGEKKSGTFDLAPGSYIAFCNIIDQMGVGGMMPGGNSPSSMMGGTSSGHVHYARGMHQLVTVE